MRTRKLVTIALMVSIGIVLSIVESFIPFPLPGIKLGLANVVTLIVLYIYSYKEALLVSIVRVLLVGLIYTGFLSQAFFLSLSGAFLSLVVMLIMYFLKRFSLYTISISSAMAHSTGQIILSAFLISSSKVFLYLPLLLFISIITGLVTGIIAFYALKIFKIEIITPKTASLITFSVLFSLFLSIFIFMRVYDNKNNSYAYITYDNERIIVIDLDNPSEYRSLVINEVFVDEYQKDGAHYFKFNVYNKDYKEYYDLVIEVKDSKIRIVEETSKNHICSNMGSIHNKYESLVCMPNGFIVSIEDNSIDEIDNLM